MARSDAADDASFDAGASPMLGGALSLWRYRARDTRNGGAECRGECAAETAAAARASLRRVGLQVVSIERVGRGKRSGSGTGIRSAWMRWRRGRRQGVRAELFDSLATLIHSGVPLAEAVDILCSSRHRGSDSARHMLLATRERLRAGASFSDALGEHVGWFDEPTLAMVRAAQRAGTLARVLRELSDRQARSDAVSRRLIGVMVYPAIVTVVALAVVVFLSQRTLPELTRILTDAGIEVPALTRWVMGVGDAVVGGWAALLFASAVVVIGGPILLRWARARSPRLNNGLRSLIPAVLRRIALGRVLTQLAQLLHSDLRVVEALRVVAPTVRGLAADLGRALAATADRIEQGTDIASSLAEEPFWFDEELCRMVAVGEASGELVAILERIGERQERAAHRAVDHLTSLLEPAVILGLAALVGIVAMAAVLPLVRLQQLV